MAKDKTDYELPSWQKSNVDRTNKDLGLGNTPEGRDSSMGANKQEGAGPPSKMKY